MFVIWFLWESVCVDGGVGDLDLKYDVETVFWCVDLLSSYL